MAYAAQMSLCNTMVHSITCLRLSDFPISAEILGFPLEEIGFLEEVIKKLDGSSRSKRVKALDRQIREALHRVEDVFDSVLTNLILIAQSDLSIGDEVRLIDVEVRQEANFFAETVKMIMEEYSKGLDYPDQEEGDGGGGDDDDEEEKEEEGDDEDDEEEDNDDEVEEDEEEEEDYDNEEEGNEEEEEEEDDDDNEEESSRIDFGGKRSKFVDFSNELTKIKDELITANKLYELSVVSCKSAGAKALFDNPDAAHLFKLRAWVSIGPKYEPEEILLSILSQIDDPTGSDHKLLVSKGEEKIFEYLHTSLKGRRYLIVLDDIWETQMWEYLRKLFPDENNGSRVLLTTHLDEVAPTHALNKQQSWSLLSQILFRPRELCPVELETAGKKIAENCKDLVEVANVANLLSKVDKTPEHWNKVAAEMENSVAMDAYDEILEISKTGGDDYHKFPRFSSAKIIEKVFGISNENNDKKMNMFPNVLYPYLKVIAIVGMAGIGKTALAREIFEDPWALSCYDHRVWVTLGPKYKLERMLEDILAQLDPNVDRKHMKADDISSILSSKRCLIVLDNVCDRNFWLYLQEYLADIKCEVLLTTRLTEVPSAHIRGDRIHEIRLLYKEESWSLLRERVFGEKKCPRELEKPGKLIAENCDGLPLMIVTIASLLSEADEMTEEYWNEVAKKENSVFEEAYHKLSKVLYPSYKDLDLDFKICFLYMAAFPLKYEIPISKLFMLCTVEGILPPFPISNLKDFEFRYISRFVSRSLVLVRDKKYNNQTKTCLLHSVFWHFCAREAENDRFLHVMNGYADGLAEVVEKQRRLCIHNNVLFGIKDMYDSIASISTARSLLCFGPPHQYQVPICLDLKLLKVLDALTIRFYEFPVGILKLVLLRYLALTYDGKLPASISKLWNLEFLIIQRHMSIKYPGDVSYLPVEIWDMIELKHLQIMGSNLPDGPNSDSILDKLSSILDVRAESCTKSILERIPNLEKLGIRIELTPDASEPSFSFDGITHLDKLESLKCVIINPELKPKVIAPPALFSMLPSCLNKLSLSGFGSAWEDMRPIALLPNLHELKLQCYAFRGPEWVMHEGDFRSLHYLLIEDTDLVHWRADDNYCHLQSLELLIIRHCWKLKDIPWQCFRSYCKTELADCNTSASERMPRSDFARVYSSWEGGKH